MYDVCVYCKVTVHNTMKHIYVLCKKFTKKKANILFEIIHQMYTHYATCIRFRKSTNGNFIMPVMRIKFGFWHFITVTTYVICSPSMGILLVEEVYTKEFKVKCLNHNSFLIVNIEFS